MRAFSILTQEIVDYWRQREDECGLGVDWSEAGHRCWRCGYRSVLHRCHIVPDSRYGEYIASNLVLLVVAATAKRQTWLTSGSCGYG
jgi:hypothetical protein